jgi:hypothetical protein
MLAIAQDPSWYIAGGFFLWCHSCAFSAVTRLLELPRLGCYFIVLLLSDVMTIHFFFLVSLPTFFPSRFHQCFALYLIALHLHEDQWRNLFFCLAICTERVEHNLSKSDSWHNSLCVELRISLWWFHWSLVTFLFVVGFWVLGYRLRI